MSLIFREVLQQGLPLLVGDSATWSRNATETPTLIREKSVKRLSDDRVASWVYFVQAGDDGHIKIGTAIRPERRFASLQTGHPSKLRFLGAIPGDASVEREWHSRFIKYRVRGEWFRPDPELLAAIETALYDL